MQVLILNGSPRKGGNTQVALGEMKKIFDEDLIGKLTALGAQIRRVED